MKIADPVTRYAVRLGDDALILGNRLSEWMSHAPFLEEDIALGNVALDFIGRARLFYQYAAQRIGGECTEDSLAYTRDVRDFTNLLLCELPRGDFAFTICRQFLYDAYSLPFTEALSHSADPQLAAIGAKAVKESRYHFRRSRDWMLRLGDGTEESHARMQDALNYLWPYVGEFFASDDVDAAMAEAGIAPDPASLREEYDALVGKVLAEATLTIPASKYAHKGGRTGYMHTEHLGHLLTSMQWLQRAYPGCEW